MKCNREARTRNVLKLWRLMVAAILTITFPLPAHAWLDFGHMAVAYVAYKRLKAAKRVRVDALLKLNPYYSRWSGQVSGKEKGAQIFMLAATWPDLIKIDPEYVADGLDGGDKPDGPLVAQNIGYSDKMMHKYWHFVDVPFSNDATALPPPLVPNARTQISAFRAVLASDSSDSLKSYDLVWLLHIIGDIHQPLHCTTRVSKMEPDGDNGGNNVKLQSDERVLHRFWDGAPGTGYTGLIGDVPKYVARLKPANGTMAAVRDEKEWIDESFRLARSKVYVAPIEEGDGPFKLSEDYRKSAVTLANERVQLAGERLANLINNELK